MSEGISPGEREIGNFLELIAAGCISIGVVGLGIAALVLGQADQEGALFIGGIVLVAVPFCIFIMLCCKEYLDDIRKSAELKRLELNVIIDDKTGEVTNTGA